VQNYTTFPQAVLWAAIDLRRKRKKKKKKKKRKYSCKQQLRGQAQKRQNEELSTARSSRPTTT
ncbi:hypothetical protein M9458_055421, partial [Cirrhinus mrigala]